MSRRIAVWTYKIMFSGKVRIIIKLCHVKKNVSELKVSWRKFLSKKSSLLQLRTLHQGTVHTGSITNYYKNYFSNMLHPGIGCFYIQVASSLWGVPSYHPTSCADYFCLPLPLLMGVICFKYTPAFGLLMRVCNRKGTGRVFLHKETAMYYK